MKSTGNSGSAISCKIYRADLTSCGTGIALVRFMVIRTGGWVISFAIILASPCVYAAAPTEAADAATKRERIYDESGGNVLTFVFWCRDVTESMS
jgi:hypothetical protein